MLTTWYFPVWISDANPDELLEWSDRLFEAGCDDSTPGTFEGRAHADFHRDAKTLDEAIRSAVADAQKAGLTVARIELTKDDVATWPTTV
jgi:hypothetical protein